MKPKHLSAFEAEVLVVLLAQQTLFEQGGLPKGATIWSRTEYALAKPRAMLRPSPVEGKMDLPTVFEQRLRAVADSLVKQGLVRRRKLGGYGRQYKETLGYKLHRAQGVDYFLTPAGKLLAESLSPAHSSTCFYAVEGWIEDADVLVVSPNADGTVTVPCPGLTADGTI
ncbi:MAG: hypothetical protein HUU55_14890 [Myxococcales bacterium]|nr:hypothetical protein [Myxococcales bacterium]